MIRKSLSINPHHSSGAGGSPLEPLSATSASSPSNANNAVGGAGSGGAGNQVFNLSSPNSAASHRFQNNRGGNNATGIPAFNPHQTIMDEYSFIEITLATAASAAESVAGGAGNHQMKFESHFLFMEEAYQAQVNPSSAANSGGNTAAGIRNRWKSAFQELNIATAVKQIDV